MRTFDMAKMRVRRPGEPIEEPSPEIDPYYGMSGLGQAGLLSKLPWRYGQVYVPADTKARQVLQRDDYLLTSDEDVVVEGKSIGRGSMLVKIADSLPDRYITQEIAREGNFPTSFRVDYILKDAVLKPNNAIYRLEPMQRSTMLMFGGLGAAVLIGGLYLYLRRP